jgi:hypothetical protein
MMHTLRHASATGWLGALLLAACASSERPREEPLPVVLRKGFELPAAIGDQPLPPSFYGVVVTPTTIEALPEPRRPPTLIVEASLGAADPSHVVPELYDHLDAMLPPPGEGSIDFVVLADARTDVELLARVLHTVARTGQDPLWLATGSAEAPTRVAVDPFAFTAPGRDDAPLAYVADLRLHVDPTGITAVAEPRPSGAPPGAAALDTRYAPEDVPVRLSTESSCRWPAEAAMHELGAAMCELSGPFALGYRVDFGVPYPRLMERLVDDPRPARCMAGPPLLGFGVEPPMTARTCDGMVAVTELPAHFAAEARRRFEAGGAEP